ncbi:MAG: ribosome assembly cofactor RimP [Prevotellaceae bacterium]|nr:ribosome assembly cofactor RimP [Prevotellaceae bacterium]
MIDQQLIKNIVENGIKGSDKFIVDIKITPGNTIEVALDSDTGISIDDCVAVSRYIEASLNRDEEDFELTVYSAGLSEPLKLLRQYRKHLGKEVEVLLKSSNKIKGVLSAVNEEAIEVNYQVKELIEGKKRKQSVNKTDRFKFDEIKTTKLVINFK